MRWCKPAVVFLALLWFCCILMFCLVFEVIVSVDGDIVSSVRDVGIIVVAAASAVLAVCHRVSVLYLI